MGDLGLIPGLGRLPGGRKGNPLQYSGLENSIDCIVLGVTKSWTQLSDFHFHLYINETDQNGYKFFDIPSIERWGLMSIPLESRESSGMLLL